MFKQQEKILMERIINKLINLPNDVSKVQLSIDASHEMLKEKVIKPEERFEKEKKENIENIKFIETEIGNIKKEPPDLGDRSWHGNLCFNGIAECKNKWWIKNTKKNYLMNNCTCRE